MPNVQTIPKALKPKEATQMEIEELRYWVGQKQIAGRRLVMKAKH